MCFSFSGTTFLHNYESICRFIPNFFMWEHCKWKPISTSSIRCSVYMVNNKYLPTLGQFHVVGVLKSMSTLEERCNGKLRYPLQMNYHHWRKCRRFVRVLVEVNVTNFSNAPQYTRTQFEHTISSILHLFLYLRSKYKCVAI